MQEVTLEAKTRVKDKKSTLTELKKNGFVPGIFYRHGEENKMFYVKEIKLKQLIFTNETNLINLVIDDNKPEKCIIKEFQLDPVTSSILHFDLIGLKEGEKITVDVGVHTVGSPIGIRDGGVLQISLHKLSLECLPTDIPDRINIDISNLKIGDGIHVKDLKLENIKINNNPETTIVAVMPPTVIKETKPEEVAVETESKEPEVITKGKKVEEEE